MNATLSPTPAGPAREGGGAWRDRLWAWLRGRATPMVVFEDRIIPAASVWTGCRAWLAEFRRLGLAPGDRVVLALPPSPGFLMALTACLWEGLSTAVVAPPRDRDEADALADALDARFILGGPGACAIEADPHGLPVESAPSPRPTRLGPTPDVRLLLHTSGTTGDRRWVALSDENILSVIDSHAPRLGLQDARVLSVLPWHHAFGLVIDLLPALAGASEIVRDSSGGRDPACMLHLMKDWDITHASLVPLHVARLLACEHGPAALQRLRGGVVGGAPVRSGLARSLRSTRLRPGYGLTEASPGVTLGQPGAWEDGAIGVPVGCEVRLDESGQLLVRGPNVCLGFWENGRLVRGEPGRWLATGDLAEPHAGGLRFIGRLGANFKLSNGRLVEAERLEDRVRRLHPSIEDAVLRSSDGESLELVLGLNGSARAADGWDLSDALGALAARVRRVTALPAHDLPRTPKGAVDRGRLRPAA